MYDKLCSASNQWTLVVQYVHDHVCLPSSSYCFCLHNVLGALTPLHRWILGKFACVILCRVHAWYNMYVMYVCFSEADTLL